MNSHASEIPNVLAIAGHDPSGGAGIQADIESITANGCRCVSIITALTAQNTAGFHELYPQNPVRFMKEAKSLLADISVNACKIGLIGSIRLIKEISNILTMFPADIPVVIDPVLAAGTGLPLSDKPFMSAMRKKLFAYTTVLTPNTAEARLLTGINDIHQAAGKLLDWGCRSVLITGADEDTDRVANILFGTDIETEHYDWERLPGIYHGSGCTLSSSIAAQLALGTDIKTAVLKAQEYTWLCLKHGSQVGKIQKHPNRFFKYDEV